MTVHVILLLHMYYGGAEKAEKLTTAQKSLTGRLDGKIRIISLEISTSYGPRNKAKISF